MICIVNLWSEKQRVSSKETVESVLRYTCNTPVVENTVCISGCVYMWVLSMNVISRYGGRETVAYAASRLSATYGSTLRVLNEVN